MKNVSLWVVLLLSGTLVMAQSVEPKATFSNMLHDFGEIAEDGGKVSHEFKVKNIGSKPLIINNVQASCGCTTPEWPKSPILPGGEGTIKATFNPYGRVGDFNKSITVFTNDKDKRYVLRIVGKVNPKQLSMEDKYPYEFGSLRLKYNSLSMLTMKDNEVKTKDIPVYNKGDQELKISFTNVPKAVKVVAEPTVLAANKMGVITVTYDASQKNDFDYVRDWFYVELNGKKEYGNRIMVTAKIVEDFSNLSGAELENAPVAFFPTTTYEFGTIKEGEKAEYDFVLENRGNSNLIIRKIKSSCGCTTTTPSKQIIPPGESTVITARFDSRGKKGNNYKTVTVVTNSPGQPSQVLAIKGVVNP